MRDYLKLKINVLIDESIQINCAADILDTIFDNLILNSWQQNNVQNKDIIITIHASQANGILNMTYLDNGFGLSPKYLDNPRRILEVHETSRKAGHGLGMWIVNNTINMTGGEIVGIDGHNGFKIEFYLGDRL